MSVRNKRNLSVEVPTSKYHRKYLGDPSDPHYVPDSPLIVRQHFTAEEERELRCVCARLLANVPHSDEMIDDPFRYLATLVTVKSDEKSNGRTDAHDNDRMVPLQRQSGDARHDSTTFDPHAVLSDATTTPSEGSGRYSADTKSTTPMSSPGRGPGDQGKQLLASAKRPSTANPSGLRTQSHTKLNNAGYPHARQQRHVLSRYSTSPPAAKSLTSLSSTLARNSYLTSAPDVPKIPTNLISNPNLNKSLPALPKVQALPSTDSRPKADKLGGISRMLKTVRRPQAKPVPLSDDEARNLSVDMSRHFPDFEYDIPKKSKFEIFSFFSRRKTNAAKRATVS